MSVFTELRQLVSAGCDTELYEESLAGLMDDLMNERVNVPDEEVVLKRATGKLIAPMKAASQAGVAVDDAEEGEAKTKATEESQAKQGALESEKTKWKKFARLLVSGGAKKVEHDRSRSPRTGASEVSPKAAGKAEKRTLSQALPQSTQEKEVKTYDEITPMSRDFVYKGRLVFKSIGEASKQGQLKMDGEVMEDATKSIECFTLGNKHKNKWGAVKYGDCVGVSGLNMQKQKSQALGRRKGKKQNQRQNVTTGEAAGKP